MVARTGARPNVIWFAVLLLVAAFTAYANSFSAPLILDDWTTIQENPKIRHLATLRDAFSPPENTGVGGRPIANLSFVLNYALTGDSLRGYHVVNLLIHVLGGLALFGIVRRTLARISTDERQTIFATGVALLWVLHPLQTQSVTYISQRTESLMGLFYLTTLYCFIRATENSSRTWAALSVVTCALGMACKEGMATAPLAALLYYYTFVSASWRRLWKEHGLLCVGLMATWALLPLLMKGLRGRGVGFGLGTSAWEYPLIEAEAIARYLSLGLWPANLVFDYGTNLGPTGPFRWLCVAVVAGIFVATIIGLRRRTVWGFLGGWFLLTLATTSSVVPIPLQPIAENRPYLALAAVIVAIVILVRQAGPKLATVFITSATLALGILTHARNTDYRSDVSIWTDTVAKMPGSARARNNLGQALQQAGRVPEAKVQFEAALHIDPNFAGAHSNLASALGVLGQHAEAAEECRLALKFDPTNADAHYNLAVALTHLGQLEAAVEELRVAIRLRPYFAGAHSWLASVLLRQNRAAEAATHAEAALQAKPDLVDARFFLGVALVQLSRPAEASEAFNAVIRRQPTHVEAYHALGVALLQLGRPGEAVPPLETAIKLNPAHAAAHGNLGLALWQTGKPEAAVSHLEEALRLDPKQDSSRQNLARIRAAK